MKWPVTALILAALARAQYLIEGSSFGYADKYAMSGLGWLVANRSVRISEDGHSIKGWKLTGDYHDPEIVRDLLAKQEQ